MVRHGNLLMKSRGVGNLGRAKLQDQTAGRTEEYLVHSF